MLLFKLLRIHHWIKNLFLFIPLFFAGDLFLFEKLLPTVIAFFSFSMGASFIYVLNDIKDAEYDRQHPSKRLRPIAAGLIMPSTALMIGIPVLISGLALGYFIGQEFLMLLITYLILNIGYSIGLKNVSILDLMILSSGFLLRILAGGVASNILVSEWLLIVFFLLSLFLAIAKRRDDAMISEITGQSTRSTRIGYTRQYLDYLLVFISSIVIVAYLMYCVTSEVSESISKIKLLSTAPFVLAGVMRYLQIAFIDNNSGSPVKVLLSDKFLIVVIVMWASLFFFLLY